MGSGMKPPQRRRKCLGQRRASSPPTTRAALRFEARDVEGRLLIRPRVDLDLDYDALGRRELIDQQPSQAPKVCRPYK